MLQTMKLGHLKLHDSWQRQVDLKSISYHKTVIQPILEQHDCELIAGVTLEECEWLKM